MVAGIPSGGPDVHDLVVTDSKDDRRVLGVARRSDIDALDAGATGTTVAGTLADGSVPTVLPTSSTADAARAMIGARVDVLAVVDDGDNCVGSIALTDVLGTVGLLSEPSVELDSIARRGRVIKRRRRTHITRSAT